MAFKTISGSVVAGQTTSNGLSLNEFLVWGITTGSNMTASTFSFLGSDDGVTYAPVYDNTSTEVTCTASSGSAKGYALNPLSFAPYNWLKIRCGTAASAVVQQVVNTLFEVSLRL